MKCENKRCNYKAVWYHSGMNVYLCDDCAYRIGIMKFILADNDEVERARENRYRNFIKVK